MRFSATHDELTKLYNRTYLNEAGESFVALCERQQLNCSLLFIDLNKFKRVNDEFGHKAGDDLLMQVADIINQETRSSDIVARIGGDEFIILMENSIELDGGEVANRIHKAILSQISNEILSLGFGISIGVASRREKQHLSLSQLLQNADQAM